MGTVEAGAVKLGVAVSAPVRVTVVAAELCPGVGDVRAPGAAAGARIERHRRTRPDRPVLAGQRGGHERGGAGIVGEAQVLNRGEVLEQVLGQRLQAVSVQIQQRQPGECVEQTGRQAGELVIDQIQLGKAREFVENARRQARQFVLENVQQGERGQLVEQTAGQRLQVQVVKRKTL